MPRASKGELYSMPLNTDWWRKMTALLSLEEKGALLEACLAGWCAPLRSNPPATIPDDADAMEALFGRRFAKVEPVIRQHFRPCAEFPGFLRCAWLLAWWEQAQARYTARAAAGRKGGMSHGRKAPIEPPLFPDNGSSATSPASSSAQAQLKPSLSPASSSAQAQLKQPKPNSVFTHTRHEGAHAPLDQPRQLNHNPPGPVPVELVSPAVIAALRPSWQDAVEGPAAEDLP